MSQIEIAAIPAGLDRVVRTRSRRSELHQFLMWALLGLLALAPLPFGSNRPFLWGLIASVVGIITIAYAYALRRGGEDLRIGLGVLRLQTTLFAVYAGFMVVQILPLGPLAGLAGAGLEPWQIVPATISLAPGATILMLLRTLTYGVFFFLMLQVASSDTRRNLCFDFTLGTIVVYALIGIVSLRLGDTILGLEKWAYRGFATGTFVNRNTFATFLAFGGVIACAQIMHLATEWIARKRDGDPTGGMIQGFVLYGVALAVILATVLATQSRMGFFVTLCGAFVVAVMAALRGRRGVATVLVLVPAVVAAAGTAMVLYGEGLLERLVSLERSTEVRTDLYAQVLELIALRPWTGFGGGAFELAFPLVHQLPVSADAVWDKAHNTYLGLWSELGVIFGSIPIILVGAMAVRLIGAMLAGRGSWRGQAIAIGVIVVGALHSLVDFSLEIEATTLMFLALTAPGLATSVPTTNPRRN